PARGERALPVRHLQPQSRGGVRCRAEGGGLMPPAAAAPRGVADEENSYLDRTRSREVRRRSRRLLGSLLAPVRKTFAITVVLVVLAQAAKVAGPALIAWAVDRGLPAAMDGSWGPAIGLAVAYVISAMVAGGGTAGYINFAATVSQAILLDLRQRVFRQTQRLSLEFHESYTSGRIISDRKSTRLNSSHVSISYAVFCLK